MCMQNMNGRNMKERSSKIKDFFKNINQWLKGNAGFHKVLEDQEDEEILLPLVQQEKEEDLLLPIQNQNVKEEQELLSILYDDTVHLDHHPTAKSNQKIKEKFQQFSQKETSEMTDEMLEGLIAREIDQDQTKAVNQDQELNQDQDQELNQDQELEDLITPLLEPLITPIRSKAIPKRGMILLRSGHEFLRIKTESWFVLCSSLKLAKLFDAQKIMDLTQGQSQLTVRELWMIRTHIETILFAVMCSGDYLLSDLSISDSHPNESLMLPDDPRKTEFIDRQTLEKIIFFSKNAHHPISVQKLLWREDLSKS
jgi:hypothetical protein